ncbi:MAG TPA: class I SAM-dependent rRNA methyltransferase [Candidatus Excrementavichristensenella intestinipullorum]|nr:class I SAM-dependent rRNA methyltransferase [Candidatus Excrementavichristensenella intestinipullorum]
MVKCYLKRTRDSRVRSGHPWIFRSDIERVEGAFTPGDVAEVRSANGTFLGRAFYNPNSQISLRMLTQHDESIDGDFFLKRVQEAWAYRKLLCDTQSCRAVYAESDFLPALIVDKFSGVLVMQCLCLGMEKWKHTLTDILVQVIQPQGIYERDDVPVRRLEGMEQVTGLLYGQVPDRVEMRENGILFSVDVREGQKTGFFLDQKENRAAIAPFCPGARVLDCFCHNGSFSLHAAKYGAQSVLGVDISQEALDVAQGNAQANGFGQVRFEAHNCFDHLRALTEAKEQFDLVILDPPAFTKTRSAVESALRGYKEINLRGLRLVKPGGFLVTCSCSQHVHSDMFIDMFNQAARDARRKVRMVEFRTQGHDHPILPAAPETQYLKCIIAQVLL